MPALTFEDHAFLRAEDHGRLHFHRRGDLLVAFTFRTVMLSGCTLQCTCRQLRSFCSCHFLFSSKLLRGIEPRTSSLPMKCSNLLSYSSKPISWSAMPGSNRRHSGWKPDTLPTELMALIFQSLPDRTVRDFLSDIPLDCIRLSCHPIDNRKEYECGRGSRPSVEGRESRHLSHTGRT